MAELTGLEPAAFRVTGGRYNQLNYNSVKWNLFYEYKGHCGLYSTTKSYMLNKKAYLYLRGEYSRYTVGVE